MGVPIVGWTCANDSKILCVSGERFWLSRCGARDKKNLKSAVFDVQVGADLIDPPTSLRDYGEAGPSSPTASPRSSLP